MENDFEKQLEELIHRELRKLPELQAPATLIPRVRAALIAKAGRSWWRRPMLTWPLAIQVAFVVILLGVFVCVGFFGAEIAHVISVGFQKVAQLFLPLATIWERVSALGNALLVLSRAVSSHFLIYAALLLGTMYLTCVGVGTLWFRVSFTKR